MAALLERPGRRGEGSTQKDAQSSAIEREILALLRRPARYPPGMRDIRHELLPRYPLLRIQKAIFSLLERGLIKEEYTLGFELGFTLVKTSR